MIKQLVTIILLILGINSIGQIKTSVGNGDFSNPNNWSPLGSPSSTDKIFINHNIILNQNFTTSDTIFVNEILSLANGSILTFTNNGILKFVNNSFYNGRLGTVSVNSNIIGDVIIEKYINHCDGTWGTIGIPLNTPLSGFNLLHTGFPGAYYYPSYTWCNTYYYNESIVGGYLIPNNISDLVTRGRGFWYWYSSQTIGNGSPSSTIVQWNFPRTLSLKGSMDLTQTFNYPVTNTNSSGNNGFNLISNPYCGTINWDSNGWDKVRISNAIYMWDGCNGRYTTYRNGVGVNGGSRFLSHYQAFYVKATGNNPILRSDYRVLTTQSSQFFKENLITPNVLRVNFGGDEIAVMFDIFYNTPNDPERDGELIMGDSTKIYSHFIGDTIKYSILAIKDTTQIIPLTTLKSGNMVFDGASTFMYYDIYLLDKKLDTFNKLEDGYVYNVVESDTTFIDRFELHFNLKNTNIVDGYLKNNVKIKKGNDKIIVSFNNETFDVDVYNILGKKIHSSRDNINESTILSIDESLLILHVYNKEYSYKFKIIN